jgi:hypothetical protein
MIEAQASKQAVLEKVCASLNRTSFKIGLLGAHDNVPVRFIEMETGSSVFEEQSHFGRTGVMKTMVTLDALLAATTLSSIYLSSMCRV